MKSYITRGHWCCLYIFMIDFVSVNADWSVQLRISSSLHDGSQFFAVNGSSLIVTCEHTGVDTTHIDFIIIARGPASNVLSDRILTFISPSTSFIQGTLKDTGRATAQYTSRLTSTNISVTITQFKVNRNVLWYGCQVCLKNTTCKSSDNLTLALYANGRPVGTEISIISPPTWIEENVANDVLCKATFTTITNVSKLGFKLKVDEEYEPVNGTMALVSGNISSMTYTQSVTFTRTNMKLQCVLTWERNKEIAVQVKKLAIYYKPPNVSITGSPPPGEINENRQVNVICIADDGKPIPTITLYRGSSVISSGQGLIFNHNVTMTKDYNGLNLSCKASETTLNYNKSSGSMNYNVTFAAKNVTMTKPSGLIKENDTILLRCLSDESNPVSNIIWTRNNVIFTDSIVNTEKPGLQFNGLKRCSEIKVTAKRKCNQVLYKCYIEGYPNVTDQLSLMLKFPPETSLLSVKPNNSVKLGDTVTLTCKLSTSNPPARIVWVKGVTPMTGSYNSLPCNNGGHIISSELSFPTIKADNHMVVSCIPIWGGINQTFTRKDVTISVFFPHSVAVKKSSEEVKENAPLTLTCNAKGGNPSTVDGYQWSVKYKYRNSLYIQQEEQIITITLVNYTHAGNYTCTATNAGGSNNSTAVVLVKYAPKDISSANQAVTSAGLNNATELTYTVLSYPKLQKEHVTVYFNGTQLNHNISIESIDIDEYMVKFMIDNVQRKDIGNYTFILNNGIGNVNITRELREIGPPDKPAGIKSLATAHTMSVSWISGHSGGSTQTFQVHYKKTDASSFNITNSITDPGVGHKETYVVTQLDELTTFSFKIVSNNGNVDGKNIAESGLFKNETLAVPKVNGDLVATVSNEHNVSFSWPTVNGTITRVIIEYCTLSDNICEELVELKDEDVHKTLVDTPVDSPNDYSYKLRLYQHHENVYNGSFRLTAARKTKEEEVKQANGNGIIIGAVSGVVAASLVLVIVIIVVILIRRKKQTKDTPKPDSPVYTDVIVDTRTEDTASINSHVTDSRPQDIDRDDGDVPAQPYRNVGNYQNEVLQRDGDEMVGDVDEPHSPTGNNVSKSNWIETGDFGRHFAYMSSHDAFEAEYTTLPEGQTSSWGDSDIPELKAKNRFKNILPYDHNRVHLQEVQDTPLSDYINASYIQGYSKQVTYIAASGVTVDAIPDFWRMVWEQNISVIVMVTNLKEKGKTKCERYWPREGDVTYGDIDVALVHRSTYADYELKKFKLIQGGQQKKVSHYHYTGWPDHGVPQNAAGIFKIREAVKQQRAYGKTPVLVHCSAGIGRTGTFIALDILLDQAESEGGVDVYKCVEALRYQRMFMVQTAEQYSFIYHSMYEALVIGSASVACADFAKYFFTATADGMLEKQYQLLEATKPKFKKEEMEFAFGFGNDRKNRDKQIVPNDHFRVKPSSMPDEYINAVYVDGYKSKNSFIATQVPFDFTAKTFWRMILDEKYSTIVCLQDDPEDNVWFPMDTETLQTDVFVIEQSGKKSIGDVDIYDLTVGRQGATDYANLLAVGEERHMVKLYRVNNWADKEMSSRNISTLRKLYAEIQQWHIQLHTTEPCVAAICMNGASECGLFIGASCLFDMANAEQEVDVFHMVKQIRVNRPQFINSLEQYKHLHEVVQEYISQFGEYANFS